MDGPFGRLPERSGTAHLRQILVVDDSRLYREGLALWLTDHMDDHALETAGSLDSLIKHLDCGQPAAVVLNLASDQSAEMLSALIERAPVPTLVVIGADESNEAQVLACAQAGACGYVTKDDSLTDLVMVIEEVVGGHTRMSARISSLMLRRVRQLESDRRRPSALSSLTEREIQILRLIASGLSNRDIADELTIEVHTVKNHVHSLLTKLGVRRRGQAAAMLPTWVDPLRPLGTRALAPERLDPTVHAR